MVTDVGFSELTIYAPTFPVWPPPVEQLPGAAIRRILLVFRIVGRFRIGHYERILVGLRHPAGGNDGDIGQRQRRYGTIRRLIEDRASRNVQEAAVADRRPGPAWRARADQRGSGGGRRHRDLQAERQARSIWQNIAHRLPGGTRLRIAVIAHVEPAVGLPRRRRRPARTGSLRGQQHDCGDQDAQRGDPFPGAPGKGAGYTRKSDTLANHDAAPITRARLNYGK